PEKAIGRKTAGRRDFIDLLRRNRLGGRCRRQRRGYTDRKSAIPCRRSRSIGARRRERIPDLPGGTVVGRQSLADADARSCRAVGKGFPTLYYEFRVVRKGLEKTPDRSPQAWRALQV